MSEDVAVTDSSRASSKLVLALPKGRVLEVAIAKLRAAGLALELSSDERALRHESDAATVMVMRNAEPVETLTRERLRAGNVTADYSRQLLAAS